MHEVKNLNIDIVNWCFAASCYHTYLFKDEDITVESLGRYCIAAGTPLE
jgi:hypothetical protein